MFFSKFMVRTPRLIFEKHSEWIFLEIKVYSLLCLDAMKCSLVFMYIQTNLLKSGDTKKYLSLLYSKLC